MFLIKIFFGVKTAVLGFCSKQLLQSGVMCHLTLGGLSGSLETVGTKWLLLQLEVFEQVQECI